MPDPIIKLAIFGALLVHGIAHVGALGALVWMKYSPTTDTSGWLPARSWLSPSLSASAAATVASIFWIMSLLGGVATALSFWGILVPGEVWRPLAVASAIVSTLGIVPFFGTWPTFNTVTAMGMNIVAVLVALQWPH
jgi:hypothetical protein